MKNGVKIVKEHSNRIIGVRVELTRMLSKKGQMLYGVVIRSTRTGRMKRLFTYETIAQAFAQYKRALA